MFGILKPAMNRLSHVERQNYHRRYCSLCGCLSELYGLSSRLLLVNDIVTLWWLLAPQSGRPERYRRANCVRGGTLFSQTGESHPIEQLAAAFSVFLCGIKMQDDLQDHDRFRTRLAAWAYRTPIAKAREGLQSLDVPVDELDSALALQSEIETSKESDLIRASEATARSYKITCQSLVRAQENSLDERVAGEIGALLGRLVYLIDAFRDRETDGTESYNPLLCANGLQNFSAATSRLLEFDTQIQQILIELDNFCRESSSAIADRWQAVRASLISHVLLDPKSVTLNMVCCIPCGDGAVAVDSKECSSCYTTCACCCCCIALTMNR